VQLFQQYPDVLGRPVQLNERVQQDQYYQQQQQYYAQQVAGRQQFPMQTP
jgi:hypothetical protein